MAIRRMSLADAATVSANDLSRGNVMAVKGLLITAAAIAAVCVPVSVHASDEVIYEHGRIETADTYTDLDGWDEELMSRCIFEADVQFKGEGSGIMLRSADNTKDGTTIRAVMRNDKLTLAADGGTGSNYIYYIELDTEAVYHISLIGSYGVNNGEIDMTVDIYDAEGNNAETKEYYMILMNKMYASSGVGPEHIRVEANTVADNIKVTELRPDGLKLVSPPAAITPGSSMTITARPERQGEELDYAMQVSYSVTGEGVAISPDGVLTADADAPQQTVTVTAAGGGFSDSAEIAVMTEDIFTIEGAILNEDKTVLEALTATKNYFFDGTAVFVIMVYDTNGTLSDSFIKYVPAKAIGTRTETEIAIGYTLPEGAENDTIEIRAWSTAPAVVFEKPEGDIRVRRFFEDNGGAVEWIEERRTVVGMLNAKTVVMQIGTPVVFVDEHAVPLNAAPYIDETGSTILPAE